MGVLNVVLQNEKCEVVEEVGGRPHTLDRLLPGYDSEDFPYLRFIDPYGDTIFNGWQMMPFLDEWRRLYVRVEEEEELDLLNRVERMAETCRNGSRPLMLKFVGD